MKPCRPLILNSFYFILNIHLQYIRNQTQWKEKCIILFPKRLVIQDKIMYAWLTDKWELFDGSMGPVIYVCKWVITVNWDSSRELRDHNPMWNYECREFLFSPISFKLLNYTIVNFSKSFYINQYENLNILHHKSQPNA